MITKRCVALLTTAASVLIQTGACADDWVTVSQSKPLVAASDQIQRLSDSISVAKGQEKLELYLTYYDGSASAPPFKWLRVQSSTMEYVTDQQFKGKPSFTMDVSGDLTWGGNQILITGAGPVGATFQWVLRTPQPTITEISPKQVFSGNNLTITGTNFCPHPRYNQVTIGGQSARIVSANSTQLVVEVPEESTSGAAQLALTVAGIPVATHDLSVSISAQPYLKSLSQSFVAPGETVTIYGEGFSNDSTKDQVYIGQFAAQIVSANATSITVIAPAELTNLWQSANYLSGPYWPVRVKVGGVKARNTLSIESHNV